MEIPDIGTKDIRIEQIDIPVWDFNSNIVDPNTSSIAAPVVVDIGVPVVNVPGCVEAHQQNNPRNSQTASDDPKGTLTYCDAGMPNFNPMQFEPERILMTPRPNVDTRRREEKPAPEPPKTEVPATPPTTVQVQCPTNKQLQEQPVGFIFNNGREVVTGYELQGKECVRLVENVPIPEQIVNAIPPAGTITTTASIAVVATTSALLAKPFADLLLKVVKPTVKKVLKKVATLRGKPVPVQSVRERRGEQRDRNAAIRALRSALPKKKKG